MDNRTIIALILFSVLLFLYFVTQRGVAEQPSGRWGNLGKFGRGGQGEGNPSLVRGPLGTLAKCGGVGPHHQSSSRAADGSEISFHMPDCVYWNS